MKIKLQKFIRLPTLLAAGLMMAAVSSKADNYVGNGDNSFDGAIGNGVLKLADDGTNFNGTLTTGGLMNDTLVIYIDTGANGGFTTTTNFNDQQDGGRKSISGVEGSLRSTLTFTNGFKPKYAIALGPTNNNFGGIYQLANGNNNSLTYLGSVNLNPLNTAAGPFTFSFPATSIGLTNNTKTTLRILGTYISNHGYRSTEAIAGNVSSPFGIGYQSFSQTAYASYTFANPAATIFPLVFQVDMKAQIASGAFNPSAGDTVYGRRQFSGEPVVWLSTYPVGRQHQHLHRHQPGLQFRRRFGTV